MVQHSVTMQLNIFYNMQPDGELLELMKRVSDQHSIAHSDWMRGPLALFCRG